MSAGEAEVRRIGRYALYGELASGGMAAVHLGRMLGPVGFARTVAIKRLHLHHARDPDFVAMLLDEARLVARIKHPNVVPTLDVVAVEGEVFLVMDYVPGAPVSRIMMALGRRDEKMPVNIATGICLGILDGLHAAHEAKSEDGTPLDIVHRDVSPQNVIVGADGIARVLDFGIAKAAERLQTTQDGAFKGKLGYMSPDVLSAGRVDRRSDVWGVGVVLWEMLVGRRLFLGNTSPHSLVRTIVEGDVAPPSSQGVACSPELDDVVKRALMKTPEERFATAREMAVALEKAASPASNRVIADWLVDIVGEQLAKRAAMVEEMERSSKTDPPSLATVRSLATTGEAPPSSPRPGTAAPTDVTVVATPSRAVTHATPRRRALAIKLVVAILLVSSGLAFRELRRRHAPAAAPEPRSPASETSASQRPASPTSTAPDVSDASSVDLPPPASAPLAAPTTSARATSSRSANPAHTPPKGCSPPYTIGPPPDFIRKPKLECFTQ